ncbi:MAG: RNA 2',3'-cyclic phosphodiesterase [Planctomycetota bacterium]
MSDRGGRESRSRGGHRAERRERRPTASRRAGVARLFVAIYPPPDRVRALLDSLGRVELPDHRATPDEQVHMTVLFVGEVDASRLDGVKESVERAAAGVKPFDLRPLHLAPLPERGPARLVAAITDAPSPLLELHQRLVQRLAVGKRKAATFLPHVTLCRLRTPADVDVATPLVDVEPFRVDTLHLMQSHLGPDGATHRGLARVPLDDR